MSLISPETLKRVVEAFDLIYVELQKQTDQMRYQSAALKLLVELSSEPGPESDQSEKEPEIKPGP